MTSQQRRAAPKPPAPELTIPEDGKIDLGDGDWVRLQTKLTVERMLALLAAFDTFESSLADLPKGRVAGAMIANIELAVASLAVLVSEASVRDESGKEIVGHDAEALRQWEPTKLLRAGAYVQALKATFRSPGT